MKMIRHCCFAVVLLLAVGSRGLVLPPERGITPLMIACCDGKLRQTEGLLKAGADVHCRTEPYRRSAFHFALASPDPDPMIALLLKYAAPPEAEAELLEFGLRQFRQAGAESSEKRRASLQEALGRLIDAGAAVGRGALPEAVVHCDVPLLRKLIRKGAGVNIRGADGASALTWALRSDVPLDRIEFLLESGADPMSCDSSGSFSLFSLRSNAQMRLLLKYGARLEALPQRGWISAEDGVFRVRPGRNAKPVERPVLDYWAEWIDPELLETALRAGCRIGPEGMRKAGKNPELPHIFDRLAAAYGKEPPLTDMLLNALESGRNGNRAFLAGRGAKPGAGEVVRLFEAAARSPEPGRAEAYAFVAALLSRSGASLDSCDPESGRTPLQAAAGLPDAELVRFLLEKGADPNIPNSRHGGNALWALFSGYGRDDRTLPEKREIFELLRRHGAKFDDVDGEGNSLLLAALKSEQPVELLRLLPLDRAAVAHADRNGVTPLMLAALWYPAGLSERLLALGADPNAVDKAGWNPLFYAAVYFPPSQGCMLYLCPVWRVQNEANATVRLLLKHGARADRPDRFGAVPLHQAAAWAEPETLRLLIEAGGAESVNAEDVNGTVPLLRAARCSAGSAAVRLLLESGANPNIRQRKKPVPIREVTCFTTERDLYETDDPAITPRRRRDWLPGSPDAIRPPLFSAAIRGDAEMTELLLDYGADPGLRYYERDDEVEFSPGRWRLSPEIQRLFEAAGKRDDSLR